jgi:hypothetical protein
MERMRGVLFRLPFYVLGLWLGVVAVHLVVGIGDRGLADSGWKVAYNGLIIASGLA